MKYIVVGAGLFGSVIAERIADVLKCPVEIYERRNHIGGNCHSFVNNNTGIECHAYGTHIFHTKIPEVWAYLNRFTKFNTYRHRVMARHNGKIYPMPINLATINAIYGTDLCPEAAEAALNHEVAIQNLQEQSNLEEKAISQVGKRLYEALIKDYTQKQWHMEPKELPADIITRLPVRHDYNAEYFDDFWQGLPLDGYEALFRNIIASPLITLRLNTEFICDVSEIPQDTVIIHTGMPDRLLNYKYGTLAWRSLRFVWKDLPVRDFQGIGQMNYCDADTPFTRIHEYKHYHPERHDIFYSLSTTICWEYPEDYVHGNEAYYPINDEKNNAIYEMYHNEIRRIPNLIIGGRLGSYKYWNMDMTVANALKVFEEEILCQELQA